MPWSVLYMELDFSLYYSYNTPGHGFEAGHLYSWRPDAAEFVYRARGMRAESLVLDCSTMRIRLTFRLDGVVVY